MSTMKNKGKVFNEEEMSNSFWKGCTIGSVVTWVITMAIMVYSE